MDTIRIIVAIGYDRQVRPLDRETFLLEANEAPEDINACISQFVTGVIEAIKEGAYDEDESEERPRFI